MRLRHAALLSIALLGCSSKKERSSAGDEGEEPTTGGSASARTEADEQAQKVEGTKLVDTDYRFRVESPRPEYRLLPRADADLLERDAHAGIAGPQQRTLVVHAGEMPQQEVGALATSAYLSFQAQGAVLEAITDATFRGVPAKRYSMVINGRRSCFLYVKRQSFIFALVASAPTLVAPTDCAPLADLFESVQFDEGSIRGHVHPRRPVDETSPTYRMRDGTYESLPGAFRIAVPKGARAYSGEEAATQPPGGYDLYIETGRPQCVVGFRGDSWKSIKDRALFAESRRQFIARAMNATVLPETLSWNILGKPTKVSKLAAPQWEMFFTVVEVGDDAIESVAWCVPGMSDKTQPVVAGLMGKLEHLEDAQRSALAADLEPLPRRDDIAEPDVSFRNGKFIQYRIGLTWSAPKGPWDVDIRQTAAASPDEGVPLLRAARRDLGVNVAMIAYPTQMRDAAQFHEMLVTGSGMRHVKLGAGTASKLGKEAALSSTGEADGQLYRLTSTLRTGAPGGVGIVVVTSRPTGTEPALEEATTACEKTFELAATLPFEVTAGRYVDTQLGFEVKLASPWAVRAEADGGYRRAIAEQGPLTFELAAIPNVVWPRSDVLLTLYAADRLALRGAIFPTTEPKVTELQIGDERGRRLTWTPPTGDPIEVFALTRGRLAFVAVARGTGALDAGLAGTSLGP